MAMKTSWYIVQVVFASIGGFIAWFLGGIDGYIYALAVFVIADFITGFMRSVVERRMSSRLGSRAIFRKVLIFLLIGLSNMVDIYLLLDFGIFRTAVVFFYISNEGISILENAHAIGLPIPAKLKLIMEQLRGDEPNIKNRKKGRK